MALSVPPRCALGPGCRWAGGRTLLTPTQLFSDQGLVFGLLSRLQIPAWLILPLPSSEDKLQAYPSYLWDAAARQGRHRTGLWPLPGCGMAQWGCSGPWQLHRHLHSARETHRSCFPGGSCPGGVVGLLGFRAVEEVPQIEVGAEERGGHICSEIHSLLLHDRVFR